ncbi:VWA domain-containing protein [Alcanivorax sp. S6407]|uniref:vWA domain-containing protein n=1 Tax=Alcanivorax sp. S6407 TaxID=2926424 RepID=UPI001FF26336|nr:VWA domain-containing protein [Alcanivorax sp. S6407]
MKTLIRTPLVLAIGIALGACSHQAEQAAETRQMQEVASKPVAPQAKRMMADSAYNGIAPVMAAPQTSIAMMAPQQERDRFTEIDDNGIHRTAESPVSTFSIDVDTASYSFSRRQINHGRLPQPDAIRLEEWVNYFDYDYPAPDSPDTPFLTQVSVSDSPWRAGNKLVHIGIKGYEPKQQSRPRANLVFLLDVSGSMMAEDKLPLVTRSLRMMVDQMNPEDTVALVVYAGAAGVVLEPTEVSDKHKIEAALNQLRAGGSTAGGEGIQLAYDLAEQHFDKEAINRVILATDGDFNVGVTDQDALEGLITRQRDKGIYLSVLGFGQGNYNDSLMQTLAQNGNGVAAYIDTLNEARKVLVTESTSSLVPIAEDVKIQVEFNPATVQEYRLLGYETRALEREDFNNDKVDAGEIGAGHTVTAIYEITPVGASPMIEPGRYEKPGGKTESDFSGEYAFLKLRYKRPGESRSQLIETPVPVATTDADALQNRETAFAVAVAGAAQILKGSQYAGDWNLDDAIELAQKNKGEDAYGYRSEFIQLLRQAEVSEKI